MKKTEKIELIKGTFTPREAQEILLTLLNGKINFHNMKDFSSRERYGRPDEDSQLRLKHLKESRDRVISTFSELVNDDNERRLVTLNSTIEISTE